SPISAAACAPSWSKFLRSSAKGCMDGSVMAMLPGEWRRAILTAAGPRNPRQPGESFMWRGLGVMLALNLAYATVAEAREPPSRPAIDAPELAALGPFKVGVKTISLVDT